jgi:RNA polymerase sigma-70 factor (ECF subfamily)
MNSRIANVFINLRLIKPTPVLFNKIHQVQFQLQNALKKNITCFMEKVTDELIPTRTTLLYRLKDWQDRPSWQDFFDTYWKLIYGVAIKSGLNKAEAEDAVQETMISVVKHMPTFKYDRATGSFKAWLLTMTRWRIADQFRKRTRLPLYDSSGSIDADTSIMDKLVDPASASLDRLWDAEWEKRLLDAAIEKVKRRIDPEKYQIFDFYVNKEWPPARIAESFNIPISQVYLAKHRVTEMIAHEVQKMEMKTS